MIFVAEERIYALVAALGEGVRNAREYGTCKLGHDRSLTRANNVCVPVMPFDNRPLQAPPCHRPAAKSRRSIRRYAYWQRAALDIGYILFPSH